LLKIPKFLLDAPHFIICKLTCTYIHTISNLHDESMIALVYTTKLCKEKVYTTKDTWNTHTQNNIKN